MLSSLWSKPPFLPFEPTGPITALSAPADWTNPDAFPPVVSQFPTSVTGESGNVGSLKPKASYRLLSVLNIGDMTWSCVDAGASEGGVIRKAFD